VGIEFLISRHELAPVDLHAFAIPGMRGKYWFNGGVNPRAFVAWACGAGLGLLFSTNSLFTGPLESAVSGVDISWLIAGVAGGLIYLALRYSFPPVTQAASIPQIGLAESVVAPE
jgi:cytosine/uracil/thiamine/allantoin permease